MKANHYYRQEWAPSGVDPNILEKTLGEWLEADTKKSIDRLIQKPSTLTDTDMATLLTYLEFQRIRVPRQSTMAKELMRKTLMSLAPSGVAAEIRAGKFQLTIKDSARFEYMRMSAGQLHLWFGGMKWEVFQAGEGASFVTTDSPVSFYNPATPPPAEPGLALAGTMVFFPLDSRHLLLLRHSQFRRESDTSPLTVLQESSLEDGQVSVMNGATWNTRMVNNHNWKMVQLSGRLVVAQSKEVLEACVSDVG